MTKRDNKNNDLDAETLNAAYLPLIKDTNRILDTLSHIWTYSITVILLTLIAIGVISLYLSFLTLNDTAFFTEGIIFLIVAAFLLMRHFMGPHNSKRRINIPHWKSVLNSFVKPDNTVSGQDGQSILESLMQIVIISDEWIRRIKRGIFSTLFWPIVAVIIFIFSSFQLNTFEFQIISVFFVVYMFVLIVAVYYGVNWRFRGWQTKVARFKNFTANAVDSL